jgi:hypothetical protein
MNPLVGTTRFLAVDGVWPLDISDGVELIPDSSRFGFSFLSFMGFRLQVWPQLQLALLLGYTRKVQQCCQNHRHQRHRSFIINPEQISMGVAKVFSPKALASATRANFLHERDDKCRA